MKKKNSYFWAQIEIYDDILVSYIMKILHLNLMADTSVPNESEPP
jgi:hypothetical protein